jgi:hypothetical protein
MAPSSSDLPVLGAGPGQAAAGLAGSPQWRRGFQRRFHRELKNASRAVLATVEGTVRGDRTEATACQGWEFEGPGLTFRSPTCASGQVARLACGTDRG